ncbi:MAG: septum formation initiator family protein [Zetaproteobacteria bacterium]|nr:MAG: septum formation initiator family protein [Zetaproteobacteria bacterium]
MLWDFVFSEHGWLVYRDEVRQLQALQQQLRDMKAQRQKLASEILRLRHDPEALEELVHRELGYVHPDEYMLILPDDGKEQAGDSREGAEQ